MKKHLALTLFLVSSLLACRPDPDEIEVGELQRISQVPFVLEPHIAVNPTNPEHVAAVVISTQSEEPSAEWTLVVYTSEDAGQTWLEQEPFPNLSNSHSADGAVGFSLEGELYVVGLWGQGLIGFNHGNNDSSLDAAKMVMVESQRGGDKPWLTVHPQNGTIFVPYSGIDPTFQYQGIWLRQSSDGGETWSDALMLEEGVVVDEWVGGQAIPPFGSQAMIGQGDNIAVAWTWAPGYDTWPAGVWIATSTDGGQTFAPAQQIAETWRIISTAFHEGTYYIVYQQEHEQAQALFVAVSDDNGQSWQHHLVSGDVPLFLDLDKAPGVDVAPNGTIDVVFYAYTEGQECKDEAAYRQRRVEGWIDTCHYHLYYTYSQDKGQTFSEPLKINEQPILGERFVRTRGSSRPGEYIGMASTDEFAYPIWIDTQGEEGTQAYTVQIRR